MDTVAELQEKSLRRPASVFLVISAYLVVVLMLGGGGWPAPLAELAVEILALLVAIFLATRPNLAPVQQDRPLTLLISAYCIVLLMQLVPLPPLVWSTLPGREQAVFSLSAAGQAGQWLPISMLPDRTLAGVMSIVPPLVVLFAVRLLEPEWRVRLLLVLLGVAILAVIVGAVQVVSAGALARFYATIDGYAVGFQANRNSAADFYLIGICALVALGSAFPGKVASISARAALVAIGSALALAVVLSGSRTGVILLVVPVSMVFLLVWTKPLPRFRIPTALFSAVIIAIAVLSPSLQMLDRTFSRFSLGDGGRIALWGDAVYQIGQTFPLGSGLGTGSAMLIAAEPLDRLDNSVPNRVHNDYLEWILETGLAGLAVLVVGAIMITRRIVVAMRDPCTDRVTRAQVGFAASTILIIAIHSIVDYPLRSLAIASLLAMAIALVPRPRESMMVARREPECGSV